MKDILQILGAALMALCLVTACLLMLAAVATTDSFVDFALSATADEAQSRIDADVAALADAYCIAPETLAPYADNAADAYRDTLADWWHGYFANEGDAAIPAYLDGDAERALVADVMADAAFAAHNDGDVLRAIARDEVAFALDESVCKAVLPLRRSLADAGLAIAAKCLPMGLLRIALWVMAGSMLIAAAVIGWLLRRGACVGLWTAGGWLGLVALAVRLMDLPGMVSGLNPIAHQQLLQVLRGGLAFAAIAAAALAGLGFLACRGGKERHASNS